MEISKNAFVALTVRKVVKPLSPKVPMRCKTAILEMNLLTVLLDGESQNGIFQKTPFLPSQASKAV